MYLLSDVQPNGSTCATLIIHSDIQDKYMEVIRVELVWKGGLRACSPGKILGLISFPRVNTMELTCLDDDHFLLKHVQ